MVVMNRPMAPLIASALFFGTIECGPPRLRNPLNATARRGVADAPGTRLSGAAVNGEGMLEVA